MSVLLGDGFDPPAVSEGQPTPPPGLEQVGRLANGNVAFV